ncbi:MAG: YciI family protein [Rhizobacter sp.]
MSSYMLIIHEPIGQRIERGEAEGRVVYDRMLKWGAQLKERGVLLAGESLKSQDADTARLQVRGGKVSVLDGPFAEAKEMIGGFFLVDCQTRAEAVAIAAECPAAEWTTVEVRAVAPCFE